MLKRLRTSDYIVSGILLLAGSGSLAALPTSHDMFGQPHLEPQLAVVMGLMIFIQAAMMLFRRFRPIAVMLAVAACEMVIALVPFLQNPSTSGINNIAMALAAYSVGAHTKNLKAGIPTTLAAACTVAIAKALATGAAPEVSVSPDVLRLGSFASELAVAGIALLIGWIVQNNRKLTEAYRESADLAIQNAEMQRQTAILDERNRIARELHDTTAHHLSAIAIQTNAARALLKRNPELAASHLENVSKSIQSALDDVRSTVGKLRTPQTEAEATRTPQPTLAEVPALLEQARELGMKLTVDGPGLRESLTMPEQACAYRTLQEALTNARKHAPGQPVSVWMGDSGIRVQTTGEFEPAPVGRGMLGMHERAEAVGATLTNEPNDDGWLVELLWRTS